MNIALVHDYLKEYGGAERVLEALHEIWPAAPIFTSFVDFKSLGPHAGRIKKWDIHTSWANNWFMRKFHSPLRFLAPWIWESFDFDGFDVVISSSGWYMCRGIITPPETVHICYLHHPPRHLYGYATAVEWQKNLLVRIYATIVNSFLRIYDFEAAQRVDYFIANSKETQSRIKKFYRRDSEVVYPPVLVTGPVPPFLGMPQARATRHGSSHSSNYFLCVSRLARAKHIDLAIEACQKLNLPLKIVGKGRDRENLESRIKNKELIEFLGEISDEELDEIYEGARALIFPSEDEEFGIVVVEAMGHGVPVIAYRSGGLPETIIEGKTGVFFDELTIDAVVAALQKFAGLNKTITPQNCIKQAQKFSKERFMQQVVSFVEQKWREYQKKDYDKKRI